MTLTNCAKVEFDSWSYHRICKMDNKWEQKIDKTIKSIAFSAVSKYLRTPKDIWSELIKEFNFTIDCCASHKIICCQDITQ